MDKINHSMKIIDYSFTNLITTWFDKSKINKIFEQIIENLEKIFILQDRGINLDITLIDQVEKLELDKSRLQDKCDSECEIIRLASMKQMEDDMSGIHSINNKISKEVCKLVTTLEKKHIEIDKQILALKVEFIDQIDIAFTSNYKDFLDLDCFTLFAGIKALYQLKDSAYDGHKSHKFGESVTFYEEYLAQKDRDQQLEELQSDNAYRVYKYFTEEYIKKEPMYKNRFRILSYHGYYENWDFDIAQEYYANLSEKTDAEEEQDEENPESIDISGTGQEKLFESAGEQESSSESEESSQDKEEQESSSESEESSQDEEEQESVDIFGTGQEKLFEFEENLESIDIFGTGQGKLFESAGEQESSSESDEELVYSAEEDLEEGLV
ncbi:MAG: hypothetical protein AAFO15_01510 [Pseudomonadota bacterium]